MKDILPNAIDAERGLIALLLFPDSGRAIDLADELVQPDDFFVTANERIYAAILKLHHAGEPVTMARVKLIVGPIRMPDIPFDDCSIADLALRIRSAAFLRDSILRESTRDWQLRGGA